MPHILYEAANEKQMLGGGGLTVTECDACEGKGCRRIRGHHINGKRPASSLKKKKKK